MKIKINNILKSKKNKGSNSNINDIVNNNMENIDKVVDVPKKRRRNVPDEYYINNKIHILEYMNNFFKNKNKLSKSYYFLFIAMFVLGCGSIYLAKKTYNLFKQENFAEYSSIDNLDEVQTVNANNDLNKEQNNISNNSDTVQNSQENKTNNTTQTNKKVASTKNNDKVKTVKSTVVEKLVFSKPLEGEILKVYSPDKLIYSKTLELWKTHDGIDIIASIGTNVKSIEKGKVEKIYDDSFYGKTIVIDHEQGYKSVYANLSKDVFVKVDQDIKKGKSIGTVSNTAIGEIKDEPHLHFSLMKDNNVVDPSSIFN